MAVNPLDFVGKFDPTQPDIQKLSEGLMELQHTGALDRAKFQAAGQRQAGANQASLDKAFIDQSVPPGDLAKLNRRFSSRIGALDAAASKDAASAGWYPSSPTGTSRATALAPMAPYRKGIASNIAAALAMPRTSTHKIQEKRKKWIVNSKGEVEQVERTVSTADKVRGGLEKQPEEVPSNLVPRVKQQIEAARANWPNAVFSWKIDATGKGLAKLHVKIPGMNREKIVKVREP